MRDSLRFASIKGAKFTDCIFQGSKKESLPMRNLIIVNTGFLGKNEFERCSLDGATVGAEPDKDGNLNYVNADNLVFKNCDLSGMEMKNIRFLNGSLELKASSAKGAVFEHIILPKKADGNRATFNDVDLTGAVFLGCELYDTEFLGIPHSEDDPKYTTEALMLVFRNLDSGDSSIPTVLDNVHFSYIDMENFSFLRCHINGSIEFSHCNLAGGTIVGSQDDEPSRKIQGSLKFHKKCNLAAIEFNTLSFVGRKLEISSCIANAVYFSNVNFSPEGSSGSLFRQSHMASTMFVNCNINGVNFMGEKGNRVKLETLIIKSDNDQYVLEGCKFSHAVLDGFILDGVKVTGNLEFDDCTLNAGRFGNHTDKTTINPSQRPPMKVAGTIFIKNSHDLRGIHLNNIHFEETGCFHVEDGVCDGTTFQDIILAGQIVIKGKSSMLRTKFSGIKAEGKKARIDLKNSDLFYVEMDDNLLQNIEHQDVKKKRPPF